MRSRGLNKRVTIWNKIQVSDGFGGYTQEDELLSVSWAKIETAKTTARDLNNIGVENESINLIITVRYREDLQYSGINQFISYKGVSYAFTLAPNEVNLNNTFVKLVATRLKGDSYVPKPELILNGGFDELGSEIVVNGGFDADSDWFLGSGWSIEDGVAVADNSASGQNISQGTPLIIGKTYVVSYDVVSVSLGAFAFSDGTKTLTTRSSVGTYSETYTAENTRLRVRTISTTTGSIDNVSVKEVDPNSAWDIVSTNGTIKIENEKLNFNDAEGVVSQTISVTENATYKIAIQELNISAQIKVGGVSLGNFNSPINVNFKSNGNGLIEIIPNASQTGTIDNISVKQLL